VWCGEATTHSVIPVLVTGIQQRRVCAARGAFSLWGHRQASFRLAEASRLDSCDKHRNDGDWGGIGAKHRVRLGGGMLMPSTKFRVKRRRFCPADVATVRPPFQLDFETVEGVSAQGADGMMVMSQRDRPCVSVKLPRTPSFLCLSQESSSGASAPREVPSVYRGTGRSLFGLRTQAGWIPVTSTGMTKIGVALERNTVLAKGVAC
jgi:hypothetical protein